MTASEKKAKQRELLEAQRREAERIANEFKLARLAFYQRRGMEPPEKRSAA